MSLMTINLYHFTISRLFHHHDHDRREPSQAPVSATIGPLVKILNVILIKQGRQAPSTAEIYNPGYSPFLSVCGFVIMFRLSSENCPHWALGASLPSSRLTRSNPPPPPPPSLVYLFVSLSSSSLSVSVSLTHRLNSRRYLI